MKTKISNKILILVVTILCGVFLLPKDSLAYQDIGLRAYDGTEIVEIAIEDDVNSSPLRISKNGVTYAVSLVDPSHPDATSIFIDTQLGIKALKKVVIVPPINPTTAYYYSGPPTDIFMVILQFSSPVNLSDIDLTEQLVMMPGNSVTTSGGWCCTNAARPSPVPTPQNWFVYGVDGNFRIKAFFSAVEIANGIGSGCYPLADFTVTGKLKSGGLFIGKPHPTQIGNTVCF